MSEKTAFCARCERVFIIGKEGDFFYPDEEYYCYECVAEMEREEEEERLSEEWMEIMGGDDYDF